MRTVIHVGIKKALNVEKSSRGLCNVVCGRRRGSGRKVVRETTFLVDKKKTFRF
jgi:hypothetical protein